MRSADVHRDKIIELERFKRGQQIHAHRKSKLGLGYPIIIRPFCSSVRPFSRRRRFEGSERGISGPKKGDRRKRLDWKALKEDKRMQVYPQNEVHKSLIFYEGIEDSGFSLKNFNYLLIIESFMRFRKIYPLISFLI